MKMSERTLCEKMAAHIYQFNQDVLEEAESLESLEYLRGQVELLGDTLLYTAGADGLEDMDAAKKAVYGAFRSCGADEGKFVAAVVGAFFGGTNGN